MYIIYYKISNSIILFSCPTYPRSSLEYLFVKLPFFGHAESRSPDGGGTYRLADSRADLKGGALIIPN